MARLLKSAGRVRLVVAFVSLLGGVCSLQVLALQVGSVLDGVFTVSQADEGSQIFSNACSSCHDSDEFTGGRFRLRWLWQSVGDLFDNISTLMPESDPGSLNPREYSALVAHLLLLNGYPTGDVPLPTNLRELRDIQIESLPR